MKNLELSNVGSDDHLPSLARLLGKLRRDSDSSMLEANHLRSLGVVDSLGLLKLWTEDTPRSIFPQRRIGFLREGYEASFLALEGDPLDDWRNTRRIKLRFKQGVEVQPADR